MAKLRPWISSARRRVFVCAGGTCYYWSFYTVAKRNTSSSCSCIRLSFVGPKLEWPRVGRVFTPSSFGERATSVVGAGSTPPLQAGKFPTASSPFSELARPRLSFFPGSRDVSLHPLSTVHLHNLHTLLFFFSMFLLIKTPYEFASLGAGCHSAKNRLCGITNAPLAS